jgi:hypothetical protein
MIEWRIPLLNSVVLKTLVFSPHIFARRATDSECARWCEDPHIRDVVPHRILPEIRAVLVCRYEREDEIVTTSLDQDLMSWFASASLFSGRDDPIDASFMEKWHMRDQDAIDGGQRINETIMYFPLSLPVAAAPHWQGHLLLDPLREPVTRALQKFSSDHKFAGNFRFSMSRWFLSLNKNRRSLEDAIIDLSVGLEALLIPGDERGDKAKALAERSCAFWYENEPDATVTSRKEFKNQIYRAYDVRSRITHGSIVDEIDLMNARERFDSLLRTLYAEFVGGRLDEFDPQAYWHSTHKQCFGWACEGVSCEILHGPGATRRDY